MFRLKYLVATCVLALTVGAANATTVGTIDGNYDVTSPDTSALILHNTSGFTFTNVQVVLQGYQPGTLNHGISQTVTPGDIPVGDSTYIWHGPPTPGNLTAHDYDDEWGNTPSGYTNPNCIIGGPCALVGNFKVTFTAVISGGTLNGDAVFAVFSPTTNNTGGFVGWEGLDPTGLSETVYDPQPNFPSNATVSGTLANIDLGTPPGETPLPAALPLFAGGLGVIGLLARRRKRKAATALAAA